MSELGIPSLSEVLPEDLVAKMKREGGSDWLKNADELTDNIVPGAAVLAARQVPGADETARRVAALIESLGDEYLPEQLGIGGGGLTYTQPNYSLSAGPSSVGFQTGLFGGQFKAEVENPMDVFGKDLKDIRASIRWELPLSFLAGGNK